MCKAFAVFTAASVSCSARCSALKSVAKLGSISRSSSKEAMMCVRACRGSPSDCELL